MAVRDNETSEALTETETRLLTYLDDFQKIKSPHHKIQSIIDKYNRILLELVLPLKNTMININRFSTRITTELSDEEFGIIYSNIPLLSIILPSYESEFKNLLTLKQKEIVNLVFMIKEIVEASLEIKEKIIREPVVQVEPAKSEQEKKAFIDLQRRDLIYLQTIRMPKSVFNTKRFQILNRVKTKEEEILTNNIAIELFGKKVNEIEWKINKK